MKKILTNSIAILILRILIGGLFIWASYDKIANPDQFAIAISNYGFLPDFLVNIWAIGLPWIELVIGLLLVVGIFVEASALISALLYVSFIIALFWALIKGLDIDCGCEITDGGKKINNWYLVRDFSLLAASIWIIFGYQGKIALESLWRKKENH